MAIADTPEMKVALKEIQIQMEQEEQAAVMEAEMALVMVRVMDLVWVVRVDSVPQPSPSLPSRSD